MKSGYFKNTCRKCPLYIRGECQLCYITMYIMKDLLIG